MNKTVTININGLIFNIDDEAYAKLRKYLETIKGYFRNAEGGEDIMTDIEARIAEMFQERISDRKEVISVSDVDHMISVMGQPEDYIDEEMHENSGTSYEIPNEESEGTGPKRFFRDPDSRIVGGVCSGIGHYFGIDPIIPRLLFVVAVILGFSGVLVYLILWAIIPKAITTADKLRMKGKKVNIDSIRKSFEDEAGDLKKKWDNVGSSASKHWQDGGSKSVQNGINSFFSFMGNILQYLIKSLGKVIGLFLFMFSGFFLFVLVMSLLGIWTFDGFVNINSSINGFTAEEVSTLLFNSSSIQYLLFFGIALTVGIPLLALLYAGLKLLINIRTGSKGLGLGIAAAWIIGIFLLVIGGVDVARDFKQQDSVTQSISLPPTVADTLYIDTDMSLMPHGEDPAEDKSDNYLLKRDEEFLYIANVKLDVVESNTDSIVVTITQSSQGGSYKEAKRRAENILYHYTINEDRLIFDPFYRIDFEDKFRLQKVNVQIAIPQGKTVFFSNNAGWVIHDIENVSNTWDFDMLNHYWQMTPEGLRCDEIPMRDRSRKYDRKRRVETKTYRKNGKTYIEKKETVEDENAATPPPPPKPPVNEKEKEVDDEIIISSLPETEEDHRNVALQNKLFGALNFPNPFRFILM